MLNGDLLLRRRGGEVLLLVARTLLPQFVLFIVYIGVKVRLILKVYKPLERVNSLIAIAYRIRYTLFLSALILKRLCVVLFIYPYTFTRP